MTIMEHAAQIMTEKSAILISTKPYNINIESENSEVDSSQHIKRGLSMSHFTRVMQQHKLNYFYWFLNLFSNELEE